MRDDEDDMIYLHLSHYQALLAVAGFLIALDFHVGGQVVRLVALHHIHIVHCLPLKNLILESDLVRDLMLVRGTLLNRVA